MCHLIVMQKYNSSLFFQIVKDMLKLFRGILNKKHYSVLHLVYFVFQNKNCRKTNDYVPNQKI